MSWQPTACAASRAPFVKRLPTVHMPPPPQRQKRRLDGAINADLFEAFVEQVLVPQLRAGDVVIVDNLSSHRRRRTAQLIEAAGATLLFLPPYSPDLNPIEMVFSKIKQLLRSMGCRTREALWNAMQSVLDRVSASDATNCFSHCGYTLHLD
jgi:transposase